MWKMSAFQSVIVDDAVVKVSVVKPKLLVEWQLFPSMRSSLAEFSPVMRLAALKLYCHSKNKAICNLAD